MFSSDEVTGRGPLFPKELPVDFTRIPAGPVAEDLVAWWWISTWSFAPGQKSAQEVLAFPSSNLVFEDDGVRFWGPTTMRSTRILEGRGWVIGGLLRPAAVPSFTDQPAAWRDGCLPVAAPALHAKVRASVLNLADAIDSIEVWLADRAGPLADEARQANLLADLAIANSGINTVPELADAVGVSVRTIHRLTTKYVGLSPYTMLRRRRLQEAVAWTRENHDEALADIAARFGFTDQAHFSREARSMLGLSLTDYRRRVGWGT
ncbi:helix-turn-helix domain-containing protein [Corynebacterium sp.]|uniref:helix-turn-helix domain-containing protein n=1 Tax=Corynebacterium sp. TaxID=1720 RepID=UPI0026DCF926|nr:helix-turn-helix domain-containing protein [Corynebacterium sp.]MDO5076339.1 helix-turn-helix domain-containing protein [Corynebacterium sp.]